jgi:hypothetical protein
MKILTINAVRFLALFLLAIISFVACLHFFITSTHIAGESFGDMRIFVSAAFNYLHSGVLYSADFPLEETYKPIANIYKFPPLYVLDYVMWLGNADDVPPQFYTCYFWLNIVRYGLTIFLLSCFFVPRHNPAWWAVVISLCLLASPFYEALYGLTFDNLLLFMLVLTFILLKFNQKWPVAFLLSYVCLAKIYPFTLMLYFIFKRQWQVLIAIGIASVFWLLLSFIFTGFESHLFYYTKILPVLMREEIFMGEKNMSLLPLMIVKGIPKEFYNATLFSITALISYLYNRDNVSSNDNNPLYFGFIISTVILLVPNCWGDYQMLLLLPIVILIASAWNSANDMKILKFTKVTIALVAWIPMLGSANYAVLNLPYYSWFNIEIISSLINLRHYSALVLWLGLAAIPLLKMKLQAA